MKNEGTSGQTKGTEITRPLSLWESKMKKKSSEPYFVSRTNKLTNRTEFIGPFSLGVQNNS